MAFPLPPKFQSFVEVKPNSATDLLQTIAAYAGEKIIRIPDGTYPLGTDLIELSFDTTTPKTIIIEGAGDAVITGTGTSMFDITNIAWVVVAGKTLDMFLAMKNIQFQFNPANQNDIALDLNYCQQILENVSVKGTGDYPNRKGRGIVVGPTGCSGSPSYWHNVKVQRLYDGFQFSGDHLHAVGLLANFIQNHAYHWKNCYWSDFHGVEFGVGGEGDIATAKPFRFENIGHGFGGIHGCNYENGATALTEILFSTEGVKADPVEIFGFDAAVENALDVMVDDPRYIRINSKGGCFKGMNFGRNVQSGDGVTTTFTIPHSLGKYTVASNLYLPQFAIKPLLTDCKGECYYTIDGTNITIEFTTAPPNAANNLKWTWRVWL